MTTSDNTQRGYAAIGRVCAHWSDIEWFCQRIVEVTAPFLATDFERDYVRHPLTIVLSHMDGRNRVATAKVFVEMSVLKSATKKKVTAALNRIDNELRPERNRYVHDEWIVSRHRAARTTLRPRITKEQARQNSCIKMETRIFSNEELEAFADTLGAAVSELLNLGNEIEAEYAVAAPSLKSSEQALLGRAG